ncbi:uncharacterized protein LOC143214166 [Lasioglossum baleicum]|uniref:uncharacterized protein LOC143214166 n=1 Tax=Lasioglossum baleicum TaxID=434251 RepID=UPI003FCDA4CC
MTDRDKDIVIEIKTLNVELKKKLEAVSKQRVECAELQLEILKLYTPTTLEIVESLGQLVAREMNTYNERTMHERS